MSKHQETAGWVLLAGFGALLAYLLKNSSSLLHESVSSSIVTGAGTVTPDPATGVPQYDTSIASTIPEAEAFAIKPIASDGTLTQYPANPKGASCPIGYQLWHNAHDNSYWCLPVPGDVNPPGSLVA